MNSGGLHLPHRRLWGRISRQFEDFRASEYFAGKSIVLIGPNCDPVSELAPRVKDADILAVVNKGHRAKSFLELRTIAREVVLFHCLHPSEEVGGGTFTSGELRQKGFRHVFFPLWGKEFNSDLLTFHRTNYHLLRLKRINQESYQALRASIEGFYPNTGYAAIWTIAKGNCRQLYVSGMNFMRLPYQTGYHDHLANLQSAIALIEKYGCHNPDLDLESFRSLLKVHPIETDKALTDILSRPTERLFYLRRTA